MIFSNIYHSMNILFFLNNIFHCLLHYAINQVYLDQKYYKITIQFLWIGKMSDPVRETLNNMGLLKKRKSNNMN